MKALKAAVVCTLVFAVTALMFFTVKGRLPLEEDRRTRRAEAYRQSLIADARVRADNARTKVYRARRAAEGKSYSALDTLIDDFAGDGMAVERQKIITLKDEIKRLEEGSPERESKTRELEALEKEINEYDEAIKKLRELYEE